MLAVRSNARLKPRNTSHNRRLSGQATIDRRRPRRYEAAAQGNDSADSDGRRLPSARQHGENTPSPTSRPHGTTPATAAAGRRTLFAADAAAGAVSAGLSVSELNVEINIDTAIVSANCLKELPDDAGDECARHEHGAEHQSHGDHRPRHLLHGPNRGVARREPVLDMIFHRLDHHDCVVHDDADGQHQAEQREVVEAEPHGGHHGERADDGHRHGDQRNDGRCASSARTPARRWPPAPSRRASP